MTTVLRRPQIDLNTLLAQPNPSIDLRLQSYEASTQNFLRAVTSYKNRAIATLSERRSAHANEKKRVHEKTQAIEGETNQCKLKEIELVANMETEKEERKDAELEVAALKRQLAAIREKSQTNEAEIKQYRNATDNLRRERAAERKTLSTNATRTAPERTEMERVLGCVVEAIEAEQILIRFAYLDAAAPDSECTLVLNIAQGYRVVTASRPLTTLPLLVNTLNETGRFYDFVRDVRMAYQTQIESS